MAVPTRGSRMAKAPTFTRMLLLSYPNLAYASFLKLISKPSILSVGIILNFIILSNSSKNNFTSAGKETARSGSCTISWITFMRLHRYCRLAAMKTLTAMLATISALMLDSITFPAVRS